MDRHGSRLLRGALLAALVSFAGAGLVASPDTRVGARSPEPPRKTTEDPGGGADSLYSRLAPAVVGIDVLTGPVIPGDDPPSGTAVIIDPEGYALSASSVVPPEARKIRVFLRGGRAIDAERLRSFPEVDLVLLKLRPPPGSQLIPFPFVPLGDSDELRVGQMAYALGNAFRSISDDDQVTFAAGAISGGYVLTESRNDSPYRGPAIETTAAVNDGMGGGPLVNARGEMVGLLSLNFSRNRWLGTSIPINALKPFIASELGWFSDRQERFAAFVGLEVRPAPLVAAAAPVEGQPASRWPVVTRVAASSPAARAGVEKGDRITHWNGAPVATARELRTHFREERPGSRVLLGLERNGARREIEVVLWARF